MIDKKLRRIQIVTAAIVIVVGFFFIGCTTKHVIKICNGPNDCNTFEYTGKSSIISP